MFVESPADPSRPWMDMPRADDEYQRRTLGWKPSGELPLHWLLQNSSNTNNLAKIASSFTRAFHIEDAAGIVSIDEIRHKLPGSKSEVVTRDWFPADCRYIGITAGASTPNNQIGEAIERIAEFRGTIDVPSLLGV